jgi:hypothetical protein
LAKLGSGSHFWLILPEVDTGQGQIGAGSGMREKHEWENFRTFKQRGEWVELQFMADAFMRGYHVLKPWGEILEYDVGIEQDGSLLRVQVKSSTARNGTGYLCQFRRNYLIEESYSLEGLDLFATYVIPEKAWYLIPAAVILLPTIKYAITLCPITARKKDRYKYEHYREAWELLSRTKEELNDITTKANKNPTEDRRTVSSGRTAL